MIEASRVAVDGEEYIKIRIVKLDNYLVSLIMSIPGWFKARAYMTYGIPFSQLALFNSLTFNHMVVWKGDGDSMGALTGGIDMSDIPSNYVVDYTPKLPLRGYQIQGFNLMMMRDGLLIADQEGVGKTCQVVCSHEAKIQMGLATWGIYVTKASLTYDIYNQAKRFTDLRVKVLGGTPKKRLKMYYELEENSDTDLVIVSYELFRQDIDNIKMLHKAKPFDIMYCDEMHKAKNIEKSRVGKDVHELEVRQRYAITATPVINDLIDSYNILAWIGAMPYNLYTFKKKFCEYGDFNNIVGYKNVGEFKTILQTNMLRRLKTQVLNLPPVVPKPIYVEMTAAQKKLYKEVESAGNEVVFEDLDFEDVPTELAKYARLMQIAESTEVVGGTAGKAGSAKLSALEELLEEVVERGEKLVVFTRSKKSCLILHKYFEKYNPAMIHGDIDSQAKQGQEVSDRQMQADKFQDDESCKVIFCVSAAAREGVTLTAANNLVFMSKDFSPAYVSQAIGRIWRFGQEGGSTNSINVYSIIAKGTIDERVEQLLEEKQFVLNASVEAPLGTEKILQTLRGAA